MRIPLMAGNWKMNKTPAEAIEFLQSIQSDLVNMPQVERVVCPPYIAIPSVAAALKDTDIKIGAQDVHWKDSGAYTSAVSAPMLKGLVEYVIIGHSETRQYLGVTDEQVNLKIKAALSHELKPIFAFGETLEQNEAGQTGTVCEHQLKAGLEGISPEQLTAIVFAYEPIWAIGTGKNATPEQAQAIIGGVVRGTLKTLYGQDIAQQVRILYGGSMNGANCADLIRQPDIDGGLIGGASLKAEYVEMVRQVIEVRNLA